MTDTMPQSTSDATPDATRSGAPSGESGGTAGGGFRYAQEVGLGLLLLYVFLLLVGTYGELLDIKWIRNLPIF